MLIDAEKSGSRLDLPFAAGEDPAIAAVTAAELLLGVELADDRHREGRSAFVDAVLEIVTIERYDLEVARVHAKLMAEARRTGRPRGPHDAIIAATARARSRVVVTADARAFAGLSGVRYRLTPDG